MPTGSDHEQQPVRRNLCKSIRRNFHWKSFVLTWFIDSCVAYVIYCRLTYRSYVTHQSLDNGLCAQGYNFIPIAFGIMLYVVYIMECWHCKTRLDLICKTDTSSVIDYIEKLRVALPVVWWRAVCYHYVRRTRQVTRYRNGDAITTTQVYYERINSNTAGSVFLYHDCGVKDISKKLTDLEKYPVTKIKFSKGFVFANLQAANEFEEQRARFFQDNEQRDDYMEVREGLDIADVPFKDFMISFSNPHHRPWYTSQWTFWILSLLLLSWPLRIFIEYQTAYVHYQVTKLFGSNYLSPSSQNYTGPLTRASTMDSRELEAAMQSNYVIVPSYSEALLMDPVNAHSHLVQDRQGNLHIHTRQPWTRQSNEPLCNENVIPNYGALMSEDGIPLVVTQRSRSMSVISPRSHHEQNGLRSVSINSLSALARSGYHTLPTSPTEEVVQFPEEPPPSYEVALRMCAPLYERLRRSASSIQRLSKWTLSKGSSKDVSRADTNTENGDKDGDTLL